MKKCTIRIFFDESGQRIDSEGLSISQFTNRTKVTKITMVSLFQFIHPLIYEKAIKSPVYR